MAMSRPKTDCAPKPGTSSALHSGLADTGAHAQLNNLLRGAAHALRDPAANNTHNLHSTQDMLQPGNEHLLPLPPRPSAENMPSADPAAIQALQEQWDQHLGHGRIEPTPGFLATQWHSLWTANGELDADGAPNAAGRLRLAQAEPTPAGFRQACQYSGTDVNELNCRTHGRGSRATVQSAGAGLDEQTNDSTPSNAQEAVQSMTRQADIVWANQVREPRENLASRVLGRTGPAIENLFNSGMRENVRQQHPEVTQQERQNATEPWLNITPNQAAAAQRRLTGQRQQWASMLHGHNTPDQQVATNNDSTSIDSVGVQ